MFDLNKVLDNIAVRGDDASLYGLPGWIVSALTAEAWDAGRTIYTRSVSGFIKIPLDEFLAKLSDKPRKIHDSDDNCATYMYSNNTMVSMTEGMEDAIDVTFASLSEEHTILFEQLSKEYIGKTKKNTVSVLTSGMDGFYLSPIGTIDQALTRENYSEEILSGFDFMVKDLEAENPFGRLSVINGIPGTGKTFLVRGLINSLKRSTIVLVPPKLISEIDGPSLLPTFIQHKRSSKRPIILIIEDADACLAPRAADNMSSISSLLNHTDGILGALLDLKIVATTNQENMAFDSALTRPGRLSRHIEVDKLSAVEANKIYTRLTEQNVDKYSDKVILAKVYADAFEVCGVKTEAERDPNFDPNPGKKLMRRARKMGF